jgi:hypothetical protein
MDFRKVSYIAALVSAQRQEPMEEQTVGDGKGRLPAAV